jgi:epidermal growth factor receptor substrate 15
MIELTPTEKDYFRELFLLADADKDGVVGMTDAPAFFRKAAIDPSFLSKVTYINMPNDSLVLQIWALSDSDNKGFLKEEEFYLALRLIVQIQSGHECNREQALKSSGTLRNHMHSNTNCTLHTATLQE